MSVSAAGRSSFRFSSSRDSKADGGAPQLDELDEHDIERQIVATLWKNHRLIPPNSAFAKYWFSLIICFVMVRAAAAPHPCPHGLSRHLCHRHTTGILTLCVRSARRGGARHCRGCACVWPRAIRACVRPRLCGRHRTFTVAPQRRARGVWHAPASDTSSSQPRLTCIVPFRFACVCGPTVQCGVHPHRARLQRAARQDDRAHRLRLLR
jgi:hypothetical protein